MTGPSMRVLKHNLNRTVFLRRPEGAGAARIVKRFHAAGPLRRFGDRARARREFDGLRRARALGLPVPEPLECRRRGSHWEVATQFLPGARSLAEWLREGERGNEGQAARRELERALVTLLADLEAAGLAHPDLHAGNLLVDPARRLWLIDLARARIDAARRGGWRGHLLELAIDQIEYTTPRERARLLIALLARVSPTTRGSERRRLACELEREARVERRARVARAPSKWRRDSSATRVVAAASDGSRARPADAREVRRRHELECEGATPRMEPLAAGPIEIDSPATALDTRATKAETDATLLHRIDGDRARCDLAWDTAVRLELHALPAARAARLTLGSPPIAWLRTSGRCPHELGELAEGEARTRALHALGTWFGSLHARGLALRRPTIEAFRFSPDGSRVEALEPGELIAADPDEPADPPLPTGVVRDPRDVDALLAGRRWSAGRETRLVPAASRPERGPVASTDISARPAASPVPAHRASTSPSGRDASASASACDSANASRPSPGAPEETR